MGHRGARKREREGGGNKMGPQGTERVISRTGHRRQRDKQNGQQAAEIQAEWATGAREIQAEWATAGRDTGRIGNMGAINRGGGTEKQRG